ncbi:hypothetical protein C8R44DRAFT_745891 [Mycena epipterygia]|nr:hypothetical protein C8R44DRAFT_745891 [Mycena epipterygia]
MASLALLKQKECCHKSSGSVNWVSGFNIDNYINYTYRTIPFDVAMEGIQHTFNILREACEDQKLPTRVFNDAFHYMNCLLCLLSKKHSAFKQLSLYVTSPMSLLSVLSLRSMGSAGNIQCSTKKTRGSFFSDEAKEMVKHLLDTVQKGYLSDPAGISLYYFMGKDRDGLNIYRTTRGTNSIEGGFHMAVRRIFG